MVFSWGVEISGNDIEGEDVLDIAKTCGHNVSLMLAERRSGFIVHSKERFVFNAQKPKWLKPVKEMLQRIWVDAIVVEGAWDL